MLVLVDNNLLNAFSTLELACRLTLVTVVGVVDVVVVVVVLYLVVPVLDLLLSLLPPLLVTGEVEEVGRLD